MNYEFLECVTFWDIFSFIFSIILSALATIYIIKFFRPNICIAEPEFGDNIIKIPVANKSRCFAAINLRIEAAAVLNDKTYHLDFDRHDFLILSRFKYKVCDEETPFKRKFHVKKINYYTRKLTGYRTINDFYNLLEIKGAYLRVRVHAYHEFTGFGKAFESKFTFKDNIKNKII